ncbi:MAG TPA: hypothetical protein VKZ91_15380 [Woeseiaceae bacterium]|nr:hypothetical protein [Woeseiaceae bacterium]
MVKQKLRAFITDRNGKIVIAQPPNIPIIGWFLLLLGSWWVTAEPWHGAMAFFSAAFLFTWAWMELTQGASPIRRVFGALVLLYLLGSRLLFD